MSELRIVGAETDRLPALAATAEAAQRDPERFVAFFGEDRATIEAEIGRVERWSEATHVAARGDRVVGWIMAESEAELDRVWWWGPVVAAGEPWSAVADALYGVARAALDDRYDEEELAADARSAPFAAFAARHGFRADPASAVLRAEIVDTEPDPRVTALAPADADHVAAMHDALFPGRHTTGRRLVAAPDGLRLVLREGGRAIGYVAVELEPDGAGYIDFLGVDPGNRGRGVGSALVTSALSALGRRGVTVADLTVRVDNVAARGLYRRLGFEELRAVRPYRKGFSLPD